MNKPEVLYESVSNISKRVGQESSHVYYGFILSFFNGVLVSRAPCAFKSYTKLLKTLE